MAPTKQDLNGREIIHSSGAAAGAGALWAIGVPLARAASFSDQELIYMPGYLQLSLFKAKKLSPLEVLQAQIRRHEAVEEKINDVTVCRVAAGYERVAPGLFTGDAFPDVRKAS